MTKRATVPIHIPTLLACSLFASKEETRYYLNGVFVEARRGGVLYCATDGHRMLARFLPDKDVTASDFLIIPTRVCKSWPKPKPEEGYGTISFGPVESSIFFDEITISFRPIDGTFPHFGAIVPAQCSGETGQFNGLYVADFEKAAKILGAGLTVIHHNGLDPAVVTFSTGPDLFGVLMPMRKEADPFSRPKWLNKVNGVGGDMPAPEPQTGDAAETEDGAPIMDAKFAPEHVQA